MKIDNRFKFNNSILCTHFKPLTIYNYRLQHLLLKIENFTNTYALFCYYVVWAKVSSIFCTCYTRHLKEKKHDRDV